MPWRHTALAAAVLASLCCIALGSAQGALAPGDEVEIAARVLAGEPLELTSGEFRFDRGWTLDRPVVVSGAGRNSTFLIFASPATPNGAAVEWRGSGTLELSNLTVRLVDASAAGDVVRASAGVVSLDSVAISGGTADSQGVTGLGAGLRFVEASEGLVRGSVVTRNEGFGLVASTNSVVFIEHADFYENTGGGILLEDRASATIVESSVFDNGGAGILATGWTWFTSLRTGFSRNLGGGIEARSYAESLIVNSGISDNPGGGFSAHDQTTSTLTHNYIASNGLMAVAMWNRARVTVEYNTITYNLGHGLVAADGSQVAAHGNMITDNGGTGVVVTGTVRGSLSYNLIEKNGGSGVVCENLASAVVNNNTIIDNAHDAYLQDSSARCTEYSSTTYVNREGVQEIIHLR